MPESLLRFIRALILISSLIPLIRSETSFFGDVADRTLLFWFVTELMTLGWIYLCTLDTEFIPKRKGLTTALVIWMLVLVAVTFFAQNSFLSFFSTFERMMGLLTYLHLFFYFLVLSCMLTTEDWRKLILCIFFVGIASSVLGIYWRSERNFDSRIIGTLGNPSFVASYTVAQIFITMLVINGLWNSNYKKWAIPVLVTVIPLHVITMILTGSRSGLISLLAGFFILVFILCLYYKHLRIWFLGICVLLLSCFMLFRTHLSVLNNLPKQFQYLNRLFEISFTTDTFLVRRNLWGVAWKAFNKHPFLGWGFEGFSSAFLKFYDPVLYKDGLWYDNPHNIFLEWMINGGILSLLGFMGCFVLSYILLWKNKMLSVSEKSILSGFGGYYIVFNLNNFDSLSTLVLLFTFWAFVANRERDLSVIISDLRLSFLRKYTIRFAAFAVVFLCVYFFVIKSYQINKRLLDTNENMDLSKATFEYKRLYETALLGKYDVLIQAGLRRNSIARDTDKNIIQNYYLVADEILQDGLTKFSESGQVLNQLGHLHVYFNQLTKAIYYFEKFQILAPQRQANLVDLGIAYLESGQFVKAIKLFEDIYELDKTYDLPLIYKAIGQARLGQYNDAKKTLKQVSSESIAENGQLIILVFERSNQLTDFCNLYSDMSETDRQFINQKTYWTWFNVAFDLKDSVQLRTAFNCYRYSFNIPESEIMPILDAAIYQNIRPVAMKKYLDRFSEK